MTDLATWLHAQIDDDEQVAREATPGPWTVHTIDGSSDVYADGQGVASAREGGCASQDDAEHIARWDPARVLAECDAKRRIVAAYQQREAEAAHPHGEVFGYHATGLLTAIRMLALPYASRDGYQAEWKP